MLVVHGDGGGAVQPWAVVVETEPLLVYMGLLCIWRFVFLYGEFFSRLSIQ